MKQKKYGKYIIADPKICHGQLTVKGTRILVENVLSLVAKGMSCDKIINEWHGKVSKEAISEAVNLASQALQEKNGIHFKN
ncbi:MAG: DUF433 domain-containing protein [bacterium]